MEFHPLANIFPLLYDGEFDDLKADILANGLLEPIVIDRDNQIIDGRNRYRACIQTGVEPRFIYLEDGVDPLQFIVSLNLKRRHLTPGQLVDVGRIIRDAEEEKARGRQAVAGGDKKSEEAKSLPENFPEAISRGDARDLAAAQLGMSGKSLDAGIRAMENGTPELQEALRAGKVSINWAEQVSRLPEESQKAILENANPKQAYKELSGKNVEAGVYREIGALMQKTLKLMKKVEGDSDYRPAMDLLLEALQTYLAVYQAKAARAASKNS